MTTSMARTGHAHARIALLATLGVFGSGIATIACAPTTANGDDIDADAVVDGGTDGGIDVLPPVVERACVHAGSDAPEFLRTLGCRADFDALASDPLDVTLPGARSVKVVLDLQDASGTPALYFQDSARYRIHYAFVSTHLSGGDLPVVGELSSFNATEYFSPERRFVLGAVTHYEALDLWALELSPYDTASSSMIEQLYRAVQAATFFGPALVFHATSDSVAREAALLPDDVHQRSTDNIYAGIDYQPLSLATGVGRLRFTTAAALDAQYVSPEEILVLDEAPNDISVVQGLITEEFQTPLSHVNVLSQNRRTPNMGLRGASSNATLRALEGRYVELVVGASSYSIREVGADEARAYLDAHRPAPVTLPAVRTDVVALADIEDVTPDPVDGASLRDAIVVAVQAYGGKAAHSSLLARTTGVPTKKAFAIPASAYVSFMRDNGFFARVDALLADATFAADAAARDVALQVLRDDMMHTPLSSSLLQSVLDRIATDHGNHKMRFRTSTNSEDLDGFPCAGCYESHSGDPNVPGDVEDAIKETWASAWLFRTFEERSWYGVAHASVGMGLLVHTNYDDEEANGVAVTANPFDASGLDPAFYVNVQTGGAAEVVHPPAGVSSDQLLYYFQQPNQPTAYLSHSSLLGAGHTVLTTTQLHTLGVALAAIHARFSAAYGPAAGHVGFYAMDVEFKFDDEDTPGTPQLFIKQARPYPGRAGE